MIRRYPEQWNWIGFPREDRLDRKALARRAAAVHGAGETEPGSAPIGEPAAAASANSEKNI
jgi:hypothetical protein